MRTTSHLRFVPFEGTSLPTLLFLLFVIAELLFRLFSAVKDLHQINPGWKRRLNLSRWWQRRNFPGCGLDRHWRAVRKKARHGNRWRLRSIGVQRVTENELDLGLIAR